MNYQLFQMSLNKFKFICFFLLLVGCQHEIRNLDKNLDIRIYKTDEENKLKLYIKNLSKEKIEKIIIVIEPIGMDYKQYVYFNNFDKMKVKIIEIEYQLKDKVYLYKSVIISIVAEHKNSPKLTNSRIVEILPVNSEGSNMTE